MPVRVGRESGVKGHTSSTVRSTPTTDVPVMLLGHAITKEGRRPKFPSLAPKQYVDLAQRCWAHNPAERCATVKGEISLLPHQTADVLQSVHV